VKISQKVPLMASAIVITAFAVFSLLQYNSVRAAMVDKLESNVAETSVVLSNQITNWLSSKLALINMMAQTINADFSRETVRKTMENSRLKEEFILNYAVLETDGELFINTSTWSPPDGWDGRERPWYPLTRSGEGAVLTEPYTDSVTKDILISMVAGIKDRGVFMGGLGGDLNLKTVSDAVNTLNFDNTGYAFLFDADKNIISHPNAQLNGKKLGAVFTEGIPVLSEKLQELTVGGKAVFVKFTPLKDLRSKAWLIGVVLDKAKTMEDVNGLRISAIIWMLVSGLVSSLILYLTMSRLLLTPINNLILAADEISRGKLDVVIRETDRNDEIGLLAKAFERMGVSIRMAMKKLQQRSQ